jgi:hypothetical protein
MFNKSFLENLGLLIVKNNFPIQFVKNMWVKCLVLHLCPRVHFPSRNHFSQEILLGLVEKTKELSNVFKTLT